MDRPAGKRWPRAQRFQLSEKGAAAEVAYREEITDARAEPGRSSFDAARAAWATRHALLPGDGLYLGELVKGPLTLQAMTRSVESCGVGAAEVHDALDRLEAAGMIEAVAAPAPPPPRRW